MDIGVLTDDALLYVLRYLDINDRIAFCYACKQLRQFFQDTASVMSRVDLSRQVLTEQDCAMKEFFRDKQMTQHITELNLNYTTFMWQMSTGLEELIMSCSQLQALHVLQCGLSIRSINRILQHANMLTALSWSIGHLLPEDTDFLIQDQESNDGIRLANIKYLCLEAIFSMHHSEVLKYLVLSRCKYLEELKLSIYEVRKMYLSYMQGRDMKFFHKNNPSFFVTDTFKHLHSLTLQMALHSTFYCFTYASPSAERELFKLIDSVVLKKSRETKWKKFLISPPISTNTQYHFFHLHSTGPKHYSDEFASVEEFSALERSGLLTTLLQTRIDDSVVRKLFLENVKLCKQVSQSIRRIGGRELHSFALSNLDRVINLSAKSEFNTLFSACSNIRELNLHGYHFEENICKPLSNLKHLLKIGLMQCAITSNDNREQLNEGNLSTLVENCQNVTECNFRHCEDGSHSFSSSPINFDLLPLAKWRNLQVLTCKKIHIFDPYSFLTISKNCKFLTMLRISVETIESYVPILESAKLLKHLALDVPNLDLGSDEFWKLLRCARSLERLCISCRYNGIVNIVGAVEMLKSLTRLHVLHLHVSDVSVNNLGDFRSQIMKTLEEERSDRISCFEFTLQWPKLHLHPSDEIFHVNRRELCCMASVIALTNH